MQPSSRREGFSAIPNVKWEDVGGLDSLRKEFDRYIVRRIKHPEDYEVIPTYCYQSNVNCEGILSESKKYPPLLGSKNSVRMLTFISKFFPMCPMP